MIRIEETICAPATSLGGAIAVVRVSGSESLEICGKIFTPSDKSIKLTEQKGFKVIYGDINADNEIVDDVLLSLFRAPNSYTGEDSVEISCHASPYILSRILELLIKNGASSAYPGEFTQRAFLNGRMDLAQAEAVADVIASNARSSHRVAINQMRGGFSAEIAKLRSELLNFASLIELELDFGEEDVEFADRNKLTDIILRVKEMADSLSDSFAIGNVLKNGIPVAIVGKPNSGKSTLLNALLMEEKAIVSEIPGTTRDSIEDTIVIDGTEYRFTDTAGIHDTTDIVEILGIKKTREKIKQASVILLVDEIGDTAESINKRIDSLLKMLKGDEKRILLIINKIDLADSSSQNLLSDKIIFGNKDDILFISAKANQGLEKLKLKLSNVVIKDKLSSDDVIITNIRHYEALLHVSETMKRVLHGIKNQVPEDFLAIDIRQAIHYLGEITGEITNDEILANIFKNFCIGK